MILLYGLVDDPEAALRAWPPEAPGRAVIITAGPLHAVAAPCQAAPDPTPAALVAHDAVVTAVMQAGTVVPFRFGTVVPDADALTSMLSGEVDRLSALLGMVRGRVEMAVRAAEAVPDVTVGAGMGPGRRYLRRMGGPSLSGGLVELHRRLTAGSRASTTAGSRPGAMIAAYLVDRGAAAAFRDRLDEAAAAVPSVRVTGLTGPWAPYSFVGGPPADTGRAAGVTGA